MRRINLYTIPAGISFADELARGVLSRFSDVGDPFSLSRALILVPTRRSIRTLADAFARVSPGGVSVLPRIRALGDFDDEPSALDVTSEEDFSSDFGASLWPPMSTLRRELLLTTLIQRWSSAQAGDKSTQSLGAERPALALQLARELARVLDQATAESLAWDKLKDIVPQELAEHWDKTVQFLSILTDHWPAILLGEEKTDPAQHRNDALRAAAKRWAEQPPGHPVIAAGSTGSVPATAALLKTVAGMPLGAVVLPGIDLELDQDSWNDTAPGHPQHGMAQLLFKIEATRRDVELWTETKFRHDRVRLISESLRPADSTPLWRGFVQHKSDVVERGIKGLRTLVARTPSEEALAIACALREAIEVPTKTASLVTPDRNLARRVASELKRWNIRIDDSAGTPLAHTEPGRFLCSIADATAEEFAPIPLLALLKHPMSGLGFERRSEVRRLSIELEKDVLRGPRPAPGLEGLRRASKADSVYMELIIKLEQALGSFAEKMAHGTHALSDLVQAHRNAAELTCEEIASAHTRLWQGEAGEAAFKLFDALLVASESVELSMSGSDYAVFIRLVMDAVSVRPNRGMHPRLSILGPLEARLQQADLMILGGLNEGKWPPATDPGPWLNRPMRRELDLSQPERRVGLSAHDFAQAAAAPEVLLTRSEKDGGAPTTPSRWLTRLNMLVGGAGFAATLKDLRLLNIARSLDQPSFTPRAIDAPAPRPAVALRPRKLPVTDVERWVRDPYALYAKKILGLKKLDAIDEELGAADRGSAIHVALELFVRDFPVALPDDKVAMRVLLELGRASFGEMLERPGVSAFWWPRYERVARWFLQWEKERRLNVVRVLSEQIGTVTFDAPAGPFILTAKADRIEVLPGGAIVVADYKTGSVPTNKQVALGFSSQLTLEGAIALAGGFPGIDAMSVDALMFVSLKGDAKAGEERCVSFGDMTTGEAVASAYERFQKFVAEFDSVEMPYLSKPHVLFEAVPSDYDHLARVKEWSSESDE